MDTLHIKPARWAERPELPLTVPMPPNMTPLPAEGAVVESNRYWRRRLMDGEVVLVEEPKAPAKKEI